MLLYIWTDSGRTWKKANRKYNLWNSRSGSSQADRTSELYYNFTMCVFYTVLIWYVRLQCLLSLTHHFNFESEQKTLLNNLYPILALSISHNAIYVIKQASLIIFAFSFWILCERLFFVIDTKTMRYLISFLKIVIPGLDLFTTKINM